MYNYYELRNALQGNFYDIYYKQKVYSDKESVEKYEKNISIYVQQVCPVIPLYDRIASFHYDSSRRPLEKNGIIFSPLILANKLSPYAIQIFSVNIFLLQRKI